jgi:hypothetical protein
MEYIIFDDPCCGHQHNLVAQSDYVTAGDIGTALLLAQQHFLQGQQPLCAVLHQASDRCLCCSSASGACRAQP